MKRHILYIFLATLTPLFALQSCSLDEPVDMSHDNSGYIEFIARPTSYDQTAVSTKAGVEDIESAVYNAFLLIFDNSGNRILCSEVTNPSTTPSKSVPIDKGLSNVTACFLINVPSSFANGIKGLTKPANDASAQDNEYINTAVLSGISYGTGANFGLPFIDLDGPAEGSSPAVACIPMFGMASVNLQASTTTAQITIKRLFAKITVDLTLDMDLDGWTDKLVELNTNLQLNYYELRNMPNRVRLSESTSQCAWVSDPLAFSSTAISSGTINKKIYIKDSSTSNNKTCIFEFYAPEYYLNRATEWTDDEKSKPNNKPSDAKAINLFLDTTLSQYTFTTTDLQYEIYLGRDAISDFSLARNVNYINTLTVKGIEETDLDHRVTTTVINNPVAKEGKSANCYVIGKVGPYYFPAYKGAYNDLTKAVLCSNPNAELVELANDNPNNIVLTNKVYDADNNIVSFNIEKIADGNVVIALYDDKGTPNNTEDDEIEWSWHLWCSTTSTIDVLGWGAIKIQKYPNNNYLMDRNLGAKQAAITLLNQNDVIGLYYKYGCKEPFVNGSYCGGGTLTDNQGNPITPSWSDDKSPTDPCPPGYKVPSSDVWVEKGSHKSALGAYIYESVSTTENINFPYAGYIDSSGGKIDKVPSYPFEVLITEEFKALSVKFTNVRFTLTRKADFGILSTISNQSYQRYLGALMSFSELSNLTPTSCDVSKKAGWSSWSKYETRTLSDYELGVLKGLMTFSGETNISNFEQDFAINNDQYKNNGYQVRCVSEAPPANN